MLYFYSCELINPVNGNIFARGEGTIDVNKPEEMTSEKFSRIRNYVIEELIIPDVKKKHPEIINFEPHFTAFNRL